MTDLLRFFNEDPFIFFISTKPGGKNHRGFLIYAPEHTTVLTPFLRIVPAMVICSK